MIDLIAIQEIDTSSEGFGDLHLLVLRALIGDPNGKTCIDLCCGEMSSTRYLQFVDRLCVDVIDEPKRPKQFRFLQADVTRNWNPEGKEWDVAICSDGIEHLTKADGMILAQRMHEMARLSIIFTPLGFLSNPEAPDNSHAHRSGWLPEDLPDWQSLAFHRWHTRLNFGAVFFWRER
jgi:hypothetical protein